MLSDKPHMTGPSGGRRPRGAGCRAPGERPVGACATADAVPDAQGNEGETDATPEPKNGADGEPDGEDVLSIPEWL